MGDGGDGEWTINHQPSTINHHLTINHPTINHLTIIQPSTIHHVRLEGGPGIGQD
jgi:hypothetical protein